MYKAVNQNGFSKKITWIATDGWRGYSQPLFAVGGANCTGSSWDSPCPTNITEQEIMLMRSALRKAKINTRLMVCRSSNVFCVDVYIIVKPKDLEQGRAVVKQLLKEVDTTLAYPC